MLTPDTAGGKELFILDLPKSDAPQIRTVLAPNPSFMTQNGTNSYILGTGDVAIIDPGPALDGHLAAILAALQPGERISHIFVTHAHLDHSALAPTLANATGAPVHAFGPAISGRSAAMQTLASRMNIGGGEGVDHGFQPDIVLPDAATVTGPTWHIKAIHTPGHMGNHLCFAAGNVLFSGDHVMGWSSTLISPPDGDMADYRASLQTLAARRWHSLLPGHGAAITKPAQKLAELAAHRHAREAALLAAIGGGANSIAQMATVVYAGLDHRLLTAAHRNILAHLIDLESRKVITATPYPSPDAAFRLA